MRTGTSTLPDMAAIRSQALQLTKGLRQKDQAAEIDAINRFVRDQIRYVGDILGVETLHTPAAVLITRAGDCDDKAILNAALLKSLGYSCRFIALDQGSGFCHVWTQVLLRGNWIDLEPTEPLPTGQRVPVRRTDRLIYQAI